jgi:hypothetical protein
MAALARFWDVAPGFWGAVEERLADASPQAAQSAAAAFLSDESAVLVVAGPAAAVLEPCRRWSSVVEVEPDGSRGRTWPRR